jgi:hypothetical protein
LALSRDMPHPLHFIKLSFVSSLGLHEGIGSVFMRDHVQVLAQENEKCAFQFLLYWFSTYFHNEKGSEKLLYSDYAHHSLTFLDLFQYIIQFCFLGMQLESHNCQPGGGLFFQANIINTNGIIIKPVAINTGCMILKSTGTPIARR